MSILVNVCMSKIMCTPIKVDVCTYATYANSQTLCVKACVCDSMPHMAKPMH